MHEVTLKINVIQEDYNSEKWLRDLFDVLAPPIEQELLKQKSLIKVTIPIYFFVVPEFPLFSNGFLLDDHLLSVSDSLRALDVKP